MKSENLNNQTLVAKKQKNGSLLPLDRRPISIPKLFLQDKSLIAQLKDCGKGYSSDSGIEPIDAAELLKRLPDSFQARRLKGLFLQERNARLNNCKTDLMLKRLLIVFGDIQDVVIGSYDWTQDEVFVPSKSIPRLAKIIELPTRSESCLQKRSTQKGPNSELTF